MLLTDYDLDLLPDGSILFDKQLNPSFINVKEGDEFVVKIFNGRVTFIKKHK